MRFLLLAIAILLCSEANTQWLAREERVASWTPREYLVYSPKSLFTEVTLAGVTLKNGQKGIEITLTKRGKKIPLAMKWEKLVLKSGQQQITKMSRLRDLISVAADYSAYECTLFQLTEQQVQFFKNMESLEMIFTLNDQPYLIRVKRQSLAGVKWLFGYL